MWRRPSACRRGFCQDCDAPYCHQHWHVSDTGYGYCPCGHGKSMDPHWSPLAVDHQMHPTGDLLGVN